MIVVIIISLLPTAFLIYAINWSKKHTVQQDKEDIMIARIHWGSLIPSWLFFTVVLFLIGCFFRFVFAV